MEMPDGIYLPYILNAMPQEVFQFMQRYIYVTDNRNCKTKPLNDNETNFDRLSKTPCICNVVKGIQHAWKAGDKFILARS